ncbi:methylisocitrate lyase [Brachybacterium sp. MASK1Z-5]|uniref:Methylisocitrate lyase n=1 Tax=Brachybacterium halotolerans TaxID=2795215 RepID=A0ABS1B7T3_9MICO|nr:methylisocitrate lyase [Brachybacterium halotolerans]MBK0330674.1 methylisocitrate lyase [Brachybacterium halotolerans]
MLNSTTTPSAKRRALRALLRPGAAAPFPGAFTPLSTRLIEEQGFPGVYISGAVLANELGLPDIGLTTLTEVAARGAQIARTTDLPCLIDADTGFGEPMNVARTIQELEDAGLAGCHIEDQVNPKRCGHLEGKATVDTATAVQRIRAAVDARRDPDFLVMARTDLRAGAGLDAAIERMRALVDAGADAIFPEAMADLSEFEAVCRAVDVPVLANMTEFGKSPLYSREQLAQTGVALVIYPVTLLRTAMGEIERVLQTIRVEGSQASHVDEMLTRARLYDLVDYESFSSFDAGIFDFEVPGRAGTDSAGAADGTGAADSARTADSAHRSSTSGTVSTDEQRSES